jgi:protein TonB
MAYGTYFAETQRTRGIRWTCAAMLAIALHAGAALTLLYPRVEDDADPAGAIAIELAPVTAALALVPTEVAPGPLTQEEAPAPETRKQTNEKVAEEVPRVEPAPLAPEPTVQVPDRQPEKKAEVDNKAAPEQKSQQALAAPMTTVPPPAEAKTSDAAVAPAPGLSAIAAKAQATWQKSLVAHINRYKRYPAEARAHRMAGIVTVEFMLDRRGQVLSSRVTHSSGSAVLDEEAVGLLRRAAPLPTPPQEVPPEGIRLALPIHFRMN